MHRFDAELLSQEMQRVLSERDVCSEAVTHVVESLIQASLRGVDSHGIQLFPHYCRAVDSGRIKTNPELAFRETSPTTALLDADHAFGHHAGAVAIDDAVSRAKRHGTGAVAVRRSTHFGSAAYFGLRAADAGCIGFAFTNADALLQAHGAKEAFTGTNPICFVAPMEGEEPFCLDMSTAVTTWNKVTQHRRVNEPLPADWACDENGNPVTDPAAACSLQPSGGYKGYGLALMVEVLCSLLAGGAFSKDLIPMYTEIEARREISHFFMALDVERFCPHADFALRMREMSDRARALDPMNEQVPVVVPGDPEKHSRAQRSTNGIPVDDALFREFVSLTPEFAGATRA